MCAEREVQLKRNVTMVWTSFRTAQNKTAGTGFRLKVENLEDLRQDGQFM